MFFRQIYSPHLEHGPAVWLEQVGSSGSIGSWSPSKRVLPTDKRVPGSGTAALPRLFPALGTSQIAILSVFASMTLLFTQLVTSICVTESVHILATRRTLKSPRRGSWITEKFGAMARSLRTLPHEVKSVVSQQTHTSPLCVFELMA